MFLQNFFKLLQKIFFIVIVNYSIMFSLFIYIDMILCNKKLPYLAGILYKFGVSKKKKDITCNRNFCGDIILLI